MKDYHEIFKLNDNREDFKDFDFLPRDDYVTILDPKLYVQE